MKRTFKITSPNTFTFEGFRLGIFIDRSGTELNLIDGNERDAWLPLSNYTYMSDESLSLEQVIEILEKDKELLVRSLCLDTDTPYLYAVQWTDNGQSCQAYADTVREAYELVGELMDKYPSAVVFNIDEMLITRKDLYMYDHKTIATIARVVHK